MRIYPCGCGCAGYVELLDNRMESGSYFDNYAQAQRVASERGEIQPPAVLTVEFVIEYRKRLAAKLAREARRVAASDNLLSFYRHGL